MRLLPIIDNVTPSLTDTERWLSLTLSACAQEINNYGTLCVCVCVCVCVCYQPASLLTGLYNKINKLAGFTLISTKLSS